MNSPKQKYVCEKKMLSDLGEKINNEIMKNDSTFHS